MNLEGIMEKEEINNFLDKLQTELFGIDTFCNDLLVEDKKQAIYISLKNIQNIILELELKLNKK